MGIKFAFEKIGLTFTETTVTTLPALLNLSKRDKTYLQILSTAPDSLIGEPKRVNPEQFITVPMVGPWEQIDEDLIPTVLVQILHEEFEKKLDSLWLSIRQLDRYDELAERTAKEVGRSVVKTSIRKSLQNIHLAAKQPLIEVIQDLREKVVMTSLKAGSLVMKNGGFSREKRL